VHSFSVNASHLYLSSITILELELGVLQLERKDPRQGLVLRRWLDLRVLPEFDGRVLSFDSAVSQRCARLHVANPLSERDAVIATTALVHGMIIVTRNLSDFQSTGADLFNPWVGA
jgi:predicted nucleic acid-binding protein